MPKSGSRLILILSLLCLAGSLCAPEARGETATRKRAATRRTETKRKPASAPKATRTAPAPTPPATPAPKPAPAADYPTESAYPATMEALRKRLLILERSLRLVRLRNEAQERQIAALTDRLLTDYTDRFYIRGGFGVQVPAPPELSSAATGVGVFGGLGRYFGRSHILEAGLEWDIFPSMYARYRLEMPISESVLDFGPLVGIKYKVTTRGSLGGAVPNGTPLSNLYVALGLSAGLPAGAFFFGADLFVLVGTRNTRVDFIVAQAGFRFFL